MAMPPHEPRTYRTRMARPGLTGFRVAVKETDLWVLAARDFPPRSGKSSSRNGSSWRPTFPGTPGFSPLWFPGPPTRSLHWWSGR